MAMATPVRRHRGGALQDRPVGWARNPLTEFEAEAERVFA